MVAPRTAIMLLLLVLVLSSSCTYWRRAALTGEARYPPNLVLPLYYHGGLVYLVEVHVARDSVRGRLTASHLDCPRCPFAIARWSVDSLKVPQDPGVSGVALGAAGAGMILFVLALAISLSGQR